jgi:hypothetical protein
VWDLTSCTRTGLLSPLVWGSDVTITAAHYAGVAAEGYLLLGTSAGSVHAVECLPNCSLSGYSISSQDAGFPAHMQERDGIPGEVIAIECNPLDPSYALIGYAYGGVLLWEWGKRRKRLLCEADRTSASSSATQAASAELTCIAWHPKGKAFAAGYSDGCYAIFDAGSPAALVRQLKFGCTAALTPIVQLQWLRTRHGDTKVWVLAVAGGGEADSSSAMDGVSLLLADVAADVTTTAGAAASVTARSMKKYGPTADLRCAAFVPLAASGEQLLSATASLEPAAGDTPPLFTVIAMTVGADSAANTSTTASTTAAGVSSSSSNSSSDDGAAVATVSRIKFATLISPAPLSIELCTGWPLPQPHPLCSRAAVTCTAVLPPMPAFALMNMISTACEGHSPQYTAGSSSSSGSDAQARVLRRGAVVWAPGLPQSARDETACLSELVVLGHADGSLTLWEACAPPLPAAATASSKGSKGGSTGAAAGATATAAAGGSATSPLVFWGELPVHDWARQHLLSLVTAISSASSRGHSALAAAVTALSVQPAVSGSSSSSSSGGCYIAVGFADGLSTLLDVNSRAVDSAHPALCTVIAVAKAAPAARRGSLIGSPSHDAEDVALGTLIDDAKRELAYSETAHSSSNNSAVAAEARPAAHPIVRAIVTGHTAGVSCIAVRCEASSASFEPSLLLAVADAAGGASLSNITARTGVELVLPKPDSAASSSSGNTSTLLAFETSTVATRTGTPCTLFAALPWKVCAFDGASGQQLFALPLDLDLEPATAAAAAATANTSTAAHQHPGSHELCGLYCLEADEEDEGMPSLPPSLAASQSQSPPTPPPRRGSKVVDSLAAVSARLVVACGSRVAVVSATKSAKAKKGALTVEALNTVMPPRQSKRDSERSAGCTPHSGLFELPAAVSASSDCSERKCIAVVDVGGGLTAFLLPSLTAVYHDQLSQGAPRGCATVSSLGEVLCCTGPRELARWSLVQHYRGPVLQEPGAVRRCQVAALQGDDSSCSSSTAEGDAPKLKLREKLKARQIEGKAAGLRRLFDEAVAAPASTTAASGSSATAAGSTSLPSPADSTSSSTTASSGGRRPSRDASSAAGTARAKSELFGGKTTSASTNTAAAAADKRTKAAGDGVSQAHNQIAEATRLAHLRTEKLNTMEEKSAALNSRAENFASLAAQLNAEAGKDECCVS